MEGLAARQMVNAYQKHETTQDRSEQTLAIQTGWILDSALESLLVGSAVRAVVGEIQEAIPAAQSLPRLLLNDVVGATGRLASSLLNRWF